MNKNNEFLDCRGAFEDFSVVRLLYVGEPRKA